MIAIHMCAVTHILIITSKFYWAVKSARYWSEHRRPSPTVKGGVVLSPILQKKNRKYSRPLLDLCDIPWAIHTPSESLSLIYKVRSQLRETFPPKCLEENYNSEMLWKKQRLYGKYTHVAHPSSVQLHGNFHPSYRSPCEVLPSVSLALLP